jgi:hypothetical protein
MIGQFTFLDADDFPHSATLDDNFRWVSAETRLAQLLNHLFPPTEADTGAWGGNPGQALVHRAAEWFGAADPYILSPNNPKPSGGVY